jgi:hypothetical protein
VLDRKTLIVQPYADYVDFLDCDMVQGWTDEHLGKLTSFGCNDTHRLVTREFYDECEKLPEETT